MFALTWSLTSRGGTEQTNSPIEAQSVDIGLQWFLQRFTLHHCHEVDKCICVLYLCSLGVCSCARKNNKHKGGCWSIRPLLDSWGSVVLVWHHQGTDPEHRSRHRECLRQRHKRHIQHFASVPSLALIECFHQRDHVFPSGVHLMRD